MSDGLVGKVLVTGGAGYIGSHLVEALVAGGHSVRVLEKPGTVVDHLPLDRIEIVEADIRDREAVVLAAKDCEWVLHLAANPNLWAPSPEVFEAVNHQGTRHVLEAARLAGSLRVVHVSTESILASATGSAVITEQTRTSLDDMIGPYCRSKWLAEEAAYEAAQLDQPVVIVSPTVPVGPGDRVLTPISRLIRDFCNRRVRGYLEGDINFVDVRDVARGIVAAARTGDVGHRYLLAAEDWKILDFLRLLSDRTGIPAPTWRVPFPLALGFAHAEEWFGSVTGRVPMSTVTGVKLTQRTFRFDGSESARALGIEPLASCTDAIDDALDWYRALGRLTDD